MDQLSTEELLPHDNVMAARQELARRLKAAENAAEQARYEGLKRARLWLQREFRLCSAQHRANLVVI